MHQRGESTDQKSRCPHITLRFTEAPLMRLSVGTLRQVVKRDLPIAFVPQQLTSYGGLELLRRYLRRIELPRRLQAACAALGGDYGGSPSCQPAPEVGGAVHHRGTQCEGRCEHRGCVSAALAEAPGPHHQFREELLHELPRRRVDEVAVLAEALGRVRDH